jgi:hypothetical protein
MGKTGPPKKEGHTKFVVLIFLFVNIVTLCNTTTSSDEIQWKEGSYEGPSEASSGGLGEYPQGSSTSIPHYDVKRLSYAFVCLLLEGQQTSIAF